MTTRLKVSVVFALLAIAVVVSAAAASSTATPGLTKTSVTIGGTFPLTGPAQLYGVIPKAENAYFQYVNAHGGIYGRIAICYENFWCNTSCFFYTLKNPFVRKLCFIIHNRLCYDSCLQIIIWSNKK